jgi:hypothetical protein
VLGNHDTDGGFKREETLDYWKSPARYFSRDEHGLHVVVLDGNDPDADPDSEEFADDGDATEEAA